MIHALAPQIMLAVNVTADAVFGPLLRSVWGQDTLQPAPSYHLSVTEQAEPFPEAQEAARAVHTSQGLLHLSGAGNQWRLPGGRVAFEVGADQAYLQVPLDPSPTEALAAHLALTEVGRACGLVPLHAAVLTRRGETIAITGASGAGKSTASLRLLAQGWSLVAEDSAWLDPTTLRVVGADQGLRVFEQSLRLFAPQWLERPARHDAHGKLWLDVPREGGATLQRLYVLNGAERGALSPAAAVGALWQTAGVPLGTAAQQAVSRNLAQVIGVLPVVAVDRNALVAQLGG